MPNLSVLNGIARSLCIAQQGCFGCSLSVLLFLGSIGGAEMILVFLFLGCTALWIWALIDIIQSTFKEGANKIIWLLLVILLPFLGSVLYFAIGRGSKLK